MSRKQQRMTRDTLQRGCTQDAMAVLLSLLLPPTDKPEDRAYFIKRFNNSNAPVIIHEDPNAFQGIRIVVADHRAWRVATRLLSRIGRSLYGGPNNTIATMQKLVANLAPEVDPEVLARRLALAATGEPPKQLSKPTAGSGTTLGELLSTEPNGHHPASTPQRVSNKRHGRELQPAP